MLNYIVAVLLPVPVLRLLLKLMRRILTFYTEEISLMSVLLPLPPSSDKHFLSIDVGKKMLAYHKSCNWQAETQNGGCFDKNFL